jgi:acylphosphatase
VADPGRGGVSVSREVHPSSNDERLRLDATVIGRVQGVGFRHFVLREAGRLGLDGWVANTPAGAVRCVAEGPRDALEALLERLREGPPAAIVERVIEAFMPATGGLGTFTVRSGAHTGD